MRRLFCKVYLGFKKSRLFVYLKIFLFLDISYIQGAFFYCSAQKTTKYKEKLKYQNCSANCSSQKILSTRKNKVSEQRLRHMCIRASLPRVSVNVFFSNERCTLLLWTILAYWIQFAIFRRAVKPQDGERIY